MVNVTGLTDQEQHFYNRKSRPNRTNIFLHQEKKNEYSMLIKYKREASRYCNFWKCAFILLCFPAVLWIILAWVRDVDPVLMLKQSNFYRNQVSGANGASASSADAATKETELLNALLNLTEKHRPRMDWIREHIADLRNHEPDKFVYGSTTYEARALERQRFTRKTRVTPRVYQDVVIVTPKPQRSDDSKIEYKEKSDDVTGHELLTAFFEQVIPDFMSGKLNVHIWDRICGPYVEQLRQSPLFPRFPSHRRFVTEFKAEFRGIDYGERIFGYIHSMSAGFYQFAITSDDASELWLSTDIDPKNARLIATVFSTKGTGWTKTGDFRKYPAQISRKLQLKAGRKYYIEVLHKQARGKSHLQVLWKPPGHKKLMKIDSHYLSLFADDNDFKSLDESLKDNEFELYAPKNVPSHTKKKLDPTIEKSIYKC